MPNFVNFYVRCNISIQSKFAHARLHNALERKYFADGVDPGSLKCRRCGEEWDIEPIDDWKDATCSNCYGERLMLTSARLEFNNWGEQNGGEKERDGRVKFARTLARKLGVLLPRGAHISHSPL